MAAFFVFRKKKTEIFSKEECEKIIELGKKASLEKATKICKTLSEFLETLSIYAGEN